MGLLNPETPEIPTHAPLAPMRQAGLIPPEGYDVYAEILKRGQERGGFTEEEMQILRDAGFLDQIRPMDKGFIPLELPKEYGRAIERMELEAEAERRRLNMIRYGEEEPPVPGYPYRWKQTGVSPEGVKQYREIPSVEPSKQIKELEKGPNQFFDIFSSKRMA